MPAFEQLRDDILALPEEAQQILLDFVAFLKQRYQSAQTISSKPLNLENEPFVGIWSERPEMQDSAAWVRQLRQQHWRN